MTEEQINKKAEEYFEKEYEELDFKDVSFRDIIPDSYRDGYKACLEDNKNIATAFARWYSIFLLDFIKDGKTSIENTPLPEQLFNKFLEEYGRT